MGLFKKPLLDLKDSKLPLQGTDKERKSWSNKIDDYIENLTPDRSDRIKVNTKRHDFYQGEQAAYSNINGVLKDTKQKKGHTNQVANYAGKTVIKMAYSMANNPPKISVAALDEADWKVEQVRAQAVESYIDAILDDKVNHFWKSTYRRSCFIQGEYGDVAIKTYLVGDKIKIINHDDINNIMVVWNGEQAGSFDAVIVESYLTPEAIEEAFNIKVNRKEMPKNEQKESYANGSWNSNQFATQAQTHFIQIKSG
jgi:hypothetical protein